MSDKSIKNKIILLDIDGPISYATWHEPRVNIGDFNIPSPWVQSACDALTKIIELTDAKVVISSDWRYNYTMEQIGKVFEFYGIPNVIIDCTYKSGLNNRPDLEKTRSDEIIKWVRDNKENISTWVALDDLNLSHFFEKADDDFISKENFVWLQGDWSDVKVFLSDNIDHVVSLLNKPV